MKITDILQKEKSTYMLQFEKVRKSTDVLGVSAQNSNVVYKIVQAGPVDTRIVYKTILNGLESKTKEIARGKFSLKDAKFFAEADYYRV